MGKIISRDKLAKIIRTLQKKHKKVAFTNGCFDILHTGHIRLFKKSKSYGDYLVVALNTDGSTRRLKGKHKPIVPQNERAEIISAIQYVDYVTFFDEDTPEQILRQLKPDILVKGADYTFTNIVGHDFIKKIIRFPVIRGKSTTNIINKILSIGK